MFNQIKNVLKKNTFIYEFNAHRKCEKTKRQYNGLVDYYSKLEVEKDLNELLNLKGFGESWAKKFQKRKPKILYVGGNAFQDKSGFLQELTKFGDVIEFTKENGEYGQYPTSNHISKTLNAQRIEQILDKNEIDILFMQIWADNLDIERIKILKKKKGFKVINIGMDDRHTYLNTYNNRPGTKGLIPILDLALTTSPEVVDWYMKENVPAIFFPEASSKEFYDFLDIPKKYDVGFVGAKYGIREEIITNLERNGIKVKCFGKGWSNGKLPLEETNYFFNQCKIILGIGTIGYCKDFYALKLRDFDAPLSGSCYVTHANADLKMLYKEDQEIILCRNTEEYVDKIKKLLNNPKVLQEIASKGYHRAIKDHTYKERFKNLFCKININNA